MAVGLILVSHSADLARGSAELARQMAPSVVIAPAGGTDDGGIGTSFDRITEAIAAADTGRGAVLLYDLGIALRRPRPPWNSWIPRTPERIRIVDAPLVEGAVAAAVTAESGADRTRWRPPRPVRASAVGHRAQPLDPAAARRRAQDKLDSGAGGHGHGLGDGIRSVCTRARWRR